MTKTGRPKLFKPQDLNDLRGLVRDHPTATLDELRLAWQARAGRQVSEPTFKQALIDSGLERTKHSVSQIYEPAPQEVKRYGYKAMHRSSASEAGWVLSDAEWALAQDLFTNTQGPGRPALYERRAMVDACCYVLRTGCSWRMLPKGEFPPWPAVQKAFSRWAAAGKFDQLQDRLRQQWRERIERNAQPTAAVIDSQSTRSYPRAASRATTRARRCAGASDTSSWTRWACCWRSWSPAPACRTARLQMRRWHKRNCARGTASRPCLPTRRTPVELRCTCRKTMV